MNPRVICIVLAVALVAVGAIPALATDADVLVVGVSSDIHTLDPAVSSDNYDWRQIYPCYDRLVKYKVVSGRGYTEVEPMAAEKVDVSDDGKVWTFNIRKGIRFDDGRALDAEAVKFSFDRVAKIGKGPADNLSAIDRVEVASPYTVKIYLKNRYGPFLQTLATDAACIVNPNIMEHEQDGDLAQGWLAENTDGSGPFKLTEWSRGQRAVLTAKPVYWDGVPKLSKVIIRFMRESADRRMALERGDIDIAEGILIDQIPALQKHPDIVVRKYPSQFVEYVYINNQKPALSDPRVRQALSYAVDYDGIIKFVLQGEGVQMRGAIPDGMWAHKPDAFQYHLDPDKAKALLKEAGVEDLSLTLIYSERRPTWDRIATVLQSNFADIGVSLNLEMISNPTLRVKVDRGDFELCLGAWSPDFADPYMFMNFWFDSRLWGLPGNRSFYKNEEVDDLIRTAAAESDRIRRIKLYNKAQAIMLQEAPYIFLYQVKTIVPMRKSVKGYVYNPMLESMYNFRDIHKE